MGICGCQCDGRGGNRRIREPYGCDAGDKKELMKESADRLVPGRARRVDGDRERDGEGGEKGEFLQRWWKLPG